MASQTHYPKSAHIEKVVYHPEGQMLQVKFHGVDKIYTHKNVPLEAYNNLKKDHSAGKFYHQVIKKHYHLV